MIVSALPQGCNGLQRMDLEECSLVSLSDTRTHAQTHTHTQITDQTLSSLALNCPNMQRLVSSAHNIVSDSLNTLPPSLTLSLCYQALSHCERITDNGIRHLVGGACFDTLQVLELDNCPLITDYSLELLR